MRRNIKNWIRDLQNVGNEIKRVIFGNKLDLEKNRVVEKNKLIDFAHKNEMPYIETSAKENININEGFDLIVDELLKDKNYDQIIEKFSRKTKCELSVSSSKTSDNKKKRGCC